MLTVIVLPAAAFLPLSPVSRAPLVRSHSLRTNSAYCGLGIAPRRTTSCARFETSMTLDSVAAVAGAAFLVGGVDNIFRLTHRSAAPLSAGLAFAQLVVAGGLLVQGFNVFTTASFAIVAAALYQGTDKAGGAAARKKAFEGKTVWITGASSGIGEAMAYEFYMAGAQVILSARRKSELERVRDKCLSFRDFEGYNAVPPPFIVPLDLSKPEEMAAAVGEVDRKCGSDFVDILVHNGGVSTRALAEEMAWEVDESVMKVNYLGPVALTKAVLPLMLQHAKGGHLVAISSVQGIIGLPSRTAYSASKHAMHGFFDGLRAELASRKIDVSLICPGYVRTSLSLNAVDAKGGKYGQMDETTAQGMPPAKFAGLALDAIARKDSQIVIADDTNAHVGVYLKWIVPQVLEWVMRKRAKKALTEK